MSTRGRSTRKTGTASPVVAKPVVKAEELDDSLKKEDDSVLEAEQEESFVSFNVDDEEEVQLKNGDEEHEEEEAAEGEKADAAQSDEEMPAADSEENTAEAAEEGEKPKEDAKEEEEKPAEPALPKRENYTVAAYFKMRELSDLTVLQPFLENCTAIHVTIQGVSGKEKNMTAQMVYKTALYKPDMAALRELKLRGETLEDLKIRGEPVEPPARVYVSNIPDDTIEDLLQMLFPNATKVTIPKTAGGKSKGCAMLTFPCLEEAEQCVKENAGMKIENNELAMKVMTTTVSDRPSASKRSSDTGSSTSGSKRLRNDRACFNCGRPGHFARECVNTTDAHGRSIAGARQRSLMSSPVVPVQQQQQPNAEIMAQHMANNMAVKMQQMQERMTAVMTEKIMNQVASQIASNQQLAAVQSNAITNQASMMSGVSRGQSAGWGGMQAAGNQGQQLDGGISRSQMKKRQRQQRMRDRGPEAGDQRSNYQSSYGSASTETGFGNIQQRFGAGTTGQYGSLVGNRSGFF